ncbi:hypothetical protein CUMW_109670 [Citrus unshiu]|nr:hypothetical protein CUMW_109670 [Citrus unshiu]
MYWCLCEITLNVQVNDEREPPDSRSELLVKKLYIHRIVAWKMIDMPSFVWNMDEDFALRLS